MRDLLFGTHTHTSSYEESFAHPHDQTVQAQATVQLPPLKTTCGDSEDDPDAPAIDGGIDVSHVFQPPRTARSQPRACDRGILLGLGSAKCPFYVMKPVEQLIIEESDDGHRKETTKEETVRSSTYTPTQGGHWGTYHPIPGTRQPPPEPVKKVKQVYYTADIPSDSEPCQAEAIAPLDFSAVRGTPSDVMRAREQVRDWPKQQRDDVAKARLWLTSSQRAYTADPQGDLPAIRRPMTTPAKPSPVRARPLRGNPKTGFEWQGKGIKWDSQQRRPWTQETQAITGNPTPAGYGGAVRQDTSFCGEGPYPRRYFTPAYRPNLPGYTGYVPDNPKYSSVDGRRTVQRSMSARGTMGRTLVLHSTRPVSKNGRYTCQSVFSK